LYEDVGGNDVHIAEAALEWARLVNGCCAARIVHQVNCFDCALHSVNSGQPEPRTLFNARPAAIDDTMPNVGNDLVHQRSARTHACFGPRQVGLKRRPLA
jgi:hypothetical protein